MAFEVIDYVIFMVTLTISLMVGLYYRFSGGKQKTNREYLLADRGQHPIPVAFSLMASFMSAIAMLGGSAEAYVYGTHFFVSNVGYLLGFVVCLLIYIPVFFKLASVSVFEYLELRFGKPVRLCASVAFSVQMLMYMSVVLVAPSTALQVVTGMSYTVSIVVCGSICLLSASLGGMKAIIVTDVFQSLLMYGAIISVILTAYLNVGSFSEIWRIAREYGRINHFNFDPDPTIRHTWWTTVIGGIFTSVIMNGINQTQVQRYLTMRDYKTVICSILYFAPLNVFISLLVGFAGLAVFSKYRDCDPLREGRIKASHQILPLYVMESFQGYGLTGLFVAGIFAASLSTISPLINSLAAVTLEDYIKPGVSKLRSIQLTESSNALIAKLLSFTYGLACIGIALLASQLQSLLQASLVIFGVIGGPTLGLFSLGMLTTIGNQLGAVVGYVTGLLFTIWISIGEPRPKYVPLPTYVNNCHHGISIQSEIINRNSTSIIEPSYLYPLRLSYMYYAPLGCLVTFIVGTLVSSFSRNNKRPTDNLISPFIVRLIGKKTDQRIKMSFEMAPNENDSGYTTRM